MFLLHITHASHEEIRVFASRLERALCATSANVRSLPLRFEDV